MTPGINSCIEMDITGQAASATIGTVIYSGFGGQVRKAHIAKGGSNHGQTMVKPWSNHGETVEKVLQSHAKGCETLKMSPLKPYVRPSRAYIGGAQVDFLTGAAACVNGKGILAFPSRTHKGVPRIVPLLRLEESGLK